MRRYRGFHWRIMFLAIIASGLLLTGCGKGEPPSRVSDVIPTTVDALAVQLVGSPESETATRLAPSDKPLLQIGVYENVLVSADAAGFAQASRRNITVRDVEEMQKKVVDDLKKIVRKRGPYTVESIPYPPDQKAEKTLIATLTPQTEEAGSPEERARGKGKTIVFIRLTLSDAKTGEILRQRDYYSGTDARQPDGRPFRR